MASSNFAAILVILHIGFWMLPNKSLLEARAQPTVMASISSEPVDGRGPKPISRETIFTKQMFMVGQATS